ncbi:MAG: FkbM family methyltransferase [Planctomycetota bacterium]
MHLPRPSEAVLVAISHNVVLRRILFPLLWRLLQRDVTIRHHWTGDRIVLHLFRHKGYWWYGRRREEYLMRIVPRLLRSADVAIDAGAHVGYWALWLGHVVGPTGHVYAFEPAPPQLPYLLANADACRSQNVTVIQKALGSIAGRAPFFLEDFTGQSSSLIPGYWVTETARHLSVVPIQVCEISVDVITLDAFLKDHQITPRFVKIDTEGTELEVLTGGVMMLRQIRPRLIVEVTRQEEHVAALLDSVGYRILDPHNGRVLPPEKCKEPRTVLAIPREEDVSALGCWSGGCDP